MAGPVCWYGVGRHRGAIARRGRGAFCRDGPLGRARLPGRQPGIDVADAAGHHPHHGAAPLQHPSVSVQIPQMPASAWKGTCCCSAWMTARSLVRAPQKAEDFLRRVATTPRAAGGAFDFVSVCPPYLLVSYEELYDLLDVSPLLHPGSVVLVEYPRRLEHLIRCRACDSEAQFLHERLVRRCCSSMCMANVSSGHAVSGRELPYPGT